MPASSGKTRHRFFRSFSGLFRRNLFPLFSFPSSSLKYILVHVRENIYLRASKAIQVELKTIHFTADRGRYAASIDVTRNCASNEKVPGF